MVGIIESGLHGNMNWFGGRVDSGFFGAFGDVAWLTKVEVRLLLDYVDGEERLEVVGFSYGVARLEDVAEFLDGGLGRCSDGEIIDMKAEVDAFAVGIETTEEAGIILGAYEECGELIVEGFGGAVEAV